MSATGTPLLGQGGRVPGEVPDLLLLEEQPDDVLRLAGEARLVDVDDLELRVREPRRGLRDRVALREADADDQVVVLADERRHVRDVVGGGRGLKHASLDAELPLGSLEAVVRELVEATVVQLPLVGQQPDLDRVLVGPREAASSSPPQAATDPARAAAKRSPVSFCLRVKNLGDDDTEKLPHARDPGGHLPGPGRKAPGPPVATGEGPVRRRLGPAGRLSGSRRDARALDSPASGGKGRRPRALASRAARDAE